MNTATTACTAVGDEVTLMLTLTSSPGQKRQGSMVNAVTRAIVAGGGAPTVYVSGPLDTHATGVGVGDGVGVGVGEEVGDGFAVGEGEGVAEGVTDGFGVGVGVAFATSH